MRTEISSQSSQSTPETPQQSSLSLFDTAASVRKDEWVPVPLPAAVIGGGGIPSGHPNSRVSVVGEVTPFARQHLSGFFTPPQKCLVSILLGAPKTILHGSDERRGVCQVLQTNEKLRRIRPIIGLVDGEVCELNQEPFWTPRRAADRSQFFHKRQHKKLKGFRQPCWTGESRPPIEQNPAVELSDFKNILTPKEIIRIFNLGFPLHAMVPQTCVPFRSERRRPKTRRDLGEIIVVKTAFNQMSPEQRMQLSDHQALMRVLSGMRVNGDRQSGLYDVIVLGKSVKEVAEARGMNAASLAVTVSRVRAKMY